MKDIQKTELTTKQTNKHTTTSTANGIDSVTLSSFCSLVFCLGLSLVGVQLNDDDDNNKKSSNFVALCRRTTKSIERALALVPLSSLLYSPRLMAIYAKL